MMRKVDIIRRAGRSLAGAKARTLLTSLAISVGAFTVTLALAAGAGGQAYTDTLIKANGDARNLSVFAKTDETSDVPKEYGGSAKLPEGQLGNRDVDKIKAMGGIENVTPAYTISATYMTRGGEAKKYETNLSVKVDRTAVPLAAGSLLPDNQIPNGSVILPEAYLGVLGFKTPQAAVGQNLTLHIEEPAGAEAQDKTFTIVAVDKKSTSLITYQTSLQLSPSDGKAIHDFQTANIPGGDTYYAVSVRGKDGMDVQELKQDIEAAGYSAFTLKDLQETLFQFISVVQWGVAGFGFLAILASIFGIINTQYISVLERTQQIGLMKALGARRADVGKLFRYEAAWVGFLGGLIGTGAALLVGLLNPTITKTLNLEPGTEILQFHPLTSIVLIAVLIIVAILADYFPSRRAAKLDPIEALRTE